MPNLEYRDGMPVYKPDGKVLSEYLYDRSPVAGIVGPIGSGTSTASMMRIFATANQQAASPRDGKRHSRWGIIRPTYPELATSTLKTWLHWFPEELYGKLIRSRPMCHKIEKGDLDLEVWFLALDGPDDIAKLRSTEWTGFFNNEEEFQSYDIFIEQKSRAGRYPSKIDGGATWSGVIFDMNAPNEEHFVARMAGWAPYPDEIPEDKRLKWPKDWFLKRQPPALIEILGADGLTVTGYVENPEAENRNWLKDNYYSDLAAGSSKQWIDSRLMNRVSFFSGGDPVWPGFREEVHIAKRRLEYVPGREVIVAEDFGRRPCAIICQEIGEKVHIIEEFRRYGIGAALFAPQLKRHLEQHYRGATIKFTGDPKGADKGQASERSAYDIHEANGMKIIPARTRGHVNNIEERLEAVSYALLTGRILIDPEACPTLRGAMSGKYCWKKLDMGEAEPLKDKFSDVADCLQYLCLFLGEGRRMVGLEAVQQPVARKIYRPMKSMRRIIA